MGIVAEPSGTALLDIDGLSPADGDATVECLGYSPTELGSQCHFRATYNEFVPARETLTMETATALKCPRCHNEDRGLFQIYGCGWGSLDSENHLHIHPEPTADFDESSSVECGAKVNDEGDADPLGEETCNYRAPYSDFARAAAGEEIPIRDYTEEHGGFFKP